MDTKKKYVRKTLTKNCERCGKEFTTKERKTRFCSRSCGAKYWREIDPKICPVCNKKFIPQRNNRGKYCSKECSHEGTKKRVLLKCDQCGKEFERVKCEYKRRRKKVFCCKKCSDIWQKENLIRFKGYSD